VESIEKISPLSAQKYQRAKQFYAGGSVGANMPARPHPPFIERADGAYLYDIDKNRYIDCWPGKGAILLGHNHPAIREKLLEQTNRGCFYGHPHEQQIALAEKLRRCVPLNERFVLCNSGTEAVHKAITLARAVTGRDSIAKFAGTYHGTYEQSVLNVTTDGNTTLPISPKPYVAGVPQRAISDTLILPMNDSGALNALIREKHRLAAIIIEPVTSHGLIVINKEYLQQLSMLCKEHGILLIFDEIITGFRLGLSGAIGQNNVTPDNVTPDIALYGKVVGGGMPIGILATRKDILDPCTRMSPPLMMGGTFSGNPMSLCAANAFLDTILHDHSIYTTLEKHTSNIAAYLQDHVTQKQYPLDIRSIASLYCLCAIPETARTPEDLSQNNFKQLDEIYLHMRIAGAITNASGTNAVSLAHTSEINEKTALKWVDAIEKTFNRQPSV
jgi:glutamate-1-semialdehyde 2,1-aminomutase